MGETVPFTSNYTDVSTYDGYQFEFYCRRCGNGHRSAFRPSTAVAMLQRGKPVPTRRRMA